MNMNFNNKDIQNFINDATNSSESFSGITKSYKNSPVQRQGNKKTLIPQYAQYFPKTNRVNRFVDAFGGSGSVGLNTNYKNIVVNDKNRDIYNMLNAFKTTSPKDVIEHINNARKKYNLDTVEGWNNYKNAYNNTLEKARNPLDLYLLRETSNRPQLLNVKDNQYLGDYGAGGNAKKFFNNLSKLEKDLNRNFYKSQHINYTNDDAFDLIKQSQMGDFLYLDPPYTNTQAEYNDAWNEEKDKMLFDLLDEANKRGVLFALSNATDYKNKKGQLLENLLLKEWAKKYNRYDFDKKYSGAIANDVLITNYK